MTSSPQPQNAAKSRRPLGSVPRFIAGVGLALAALSGSSLQAACSFCDYCTDSSRSVHTLTGTATDRVTFNSSYDDYTFDLYDWVSTAPNDSTDPSEGEGLTIWASDVCVLGGTITGDIDPAHDWRWVHDEVGGAGLRIQVDYGTATLLDTRIHNVEDGFQPRERDPYSNDGDFNLRGCYFTMMRDDAIENDHFMPGVIEDSLFDGVFCFISEQHQTSGTQNGTLGSGEDTEIEITDSYIRVDTTNGVLAYPDNVTSSNWFKWKDTGGYDHHTVRIEDCVFASSSIPIYNGSVKWDRLDFPTGTVFHGTENYILWLGPTGQYGGPSVSSLTKASGATVTFLEGTAADAKWLEKKQGWLGAHGYLATNVSATAGNGQVTLSWTGGSEVVTYNVTRSSSSGGTYSTKVSGLTGTSWVDTNVTNGNTYYYIIESVDIPGVVQPSTKASATPTSSGGGGTTYQAEDATVTSASIDSNHTGYNGTGFVNSYSSGSSIAFSNVNGGSGGTVTLKIRNALGAGSSRTGLLIVNGSSQNITFSPTGAWTTWQTHSVSISLNSGTSNTITLQSNGSDLANVDEITVESATTVTFQNGFNGYYGMVDTKIKEDAQTSNWGNYNSLEMSGNPDYKSLMKWDLTSISSGKTVTAVSITFNVSNASPDDYYFHALKRDWIEAEATWLLAKSGVNWGTAGAGNTSSDVESTFIGEVTATSTGAYTVALNAAGLAQVESWIDSPSTNYGMILKNTGTADSLTLDSSEKSPTSNRPILTITYQ